MKSFRLDSERNCNYRQVDVEHKLIIFVQSNLRLRILSIPLWILAALIFRGKSRTPSTHILWHCNDATLRMREESSPHRVDNTICLFVKASFLRRLSTAHDKLRTSSGLWKFSFHNRENCEKFWCTKKFSDAKSRKSAWNRSEIRLDLVKNC